MEQQLKPPWLRPPGHKTRTGLYVCLRRSVERRRGSAALDVYVCVFDYRSHSLHLAPSPLDLVVAQAEKSE